MQNNSNCNFLILGDYNLPNVNWFPYNNIATTNLSTVNNFEANILDSFSCINMSQFNLIYNHSGSLLDLVFSHVNNASVSSETCPLVPLDQMYLKTKLLLIIHFITVYT